MKTEVKKLFIEKSDRFSGYTQLVAQTEDGKEFIIRGDYCGGIPVSSWEEVSDKMF